MNESATTVFVEQPLALPGSAKYNTTKDQDYTNVTDYTTIEWDL